MRLPPSLAVTLAQTHPFETAFLAGCADRGLTAAATRRAALKLAQASPTMARDWAAFLASLDTALTKEALGVPAPIKVPPKLPPPPVAPAAPPAAKPLGAPAPKPMAPPPRAAVAAAATMPNARLNENMAAAKRPWVSAASVRANAPFHVNRLNPEEANLSTNPLSYTREAVKAYLPERMGGTPAAVSGGGAAPVNRMRAISEIPRNLGATVSNAGTSLISNLWPAAKTPVSGGAAWNAGEQPVSPFGHLGNATMSLHDAVVSPFTGRSYLRSLAQDDPARGQSLGAATIGGVGSMVAGGMAGKALGGLVSGGPAGAVIGSTVAPLVEAGAGAWADRAEASQAAAEQAKLQATAVQNKHNPNALNARPPSVMPMPGPGGNAQQISEPIANRNLTDATYGVADALNKHDANATPVAPDAAAPATPTRLTPDKVVERANQISPEDAQRLSAHADQKMSEFTPEQFKAMDPMVRNNLISQAFENKAIAWSKMNNGASPADLYKKALSNDWDTGDLKLFATTPVGADAAKGATAAGTDPWSAITSTFSNMSQPQQIMAMIGFPMAALGLMSALGGGGGLMSLLGSVLGVGAIGGSLGAFGGAGPLSGLSEQMPFLKTIGDYVGMNAAPGAAGATPAAGAAAAAPAVPPADQFKQLSAMEPEQLAKWIAPEGMPAADAPWYDLGAKRKSWGIGNKLKQLSADYNPDQLKVLAAKMTPAQQQQLLKSIQDNKSFFGPEAATELSGVLGG